MKLEIAFLEDDTNEDIGSSLWKIVIFLSYQHLNKKRFMTDYLILFKIQYSQWISSRLHFFWVWVVSVNCQLINYHVNDVLCIFLLLANAWNAKQKTKREVPGQICALSQQKFMDHKLIAREMTVLWQEKGEIQKPLKQCNEPLESKDRAAHKEIW